MRLAGFGFVAAREMEQRAVEELAHLVVELLNAVELERQEFVGRHAIASEIDEAMLADVAVEDASW